MFLLGLVSCGVNKKSLAKQPNCEDIEGINDCDAHQNKEKFKNYSGLIKCCKNGKVEMFLTIKDGKPDGLVRKWHENGQLKAEANFKDNKPDGLIRTWNENGQLESESNHKDGKKVGLARTWHENGQLESEFNFKEGVVISEKCFDEEGNLRSCKW